MEINGSITHVRRIVENILGNAVKYNCFGETLQYAVDEIPIDKNHSTYRFTIKDTGIARSSIEKRLFSCSIFHKIRSFHLPPII